MKIKKLYAVPGLSGYFNKDYRAVKEGRDSDGLVSIGQPVTEGFDSILQPGHAISILLKLEDEQLAWGDCLDVIFAGSAGRDRIFLPKEHLSIIENEVNDFLIEKELSSFREMDKELDNFKVNGKSLHTAVRYGVSQALLDAIAKANHITIAEVIAKEYGLPLPRKAIPMAGCTLTEQKINVDRMILKEIGYLPHASFTNVERHFGPDGKKVLEYASWVRDRIQKIGQPGYKPTIHLDVYGTIGQAFSNNMQAIIEFLKRLSNAVEPFDLALETPIIAETQEEQLFLFKELRTAIKKEGLNVSLIVDEWCNTFEDIILFAKSQVSDFVKVKLPDLGVVSKGIEAALYCKKNGVKVSISGSTNGTDQSARINSHVALATGADILSVHPGQGTDEGIMILHNEMARTLKLIKENE